MKRKITIDLATDLKLDLTVEEHEVLLSVVKKSLQLARKEAKKNNPQGLLFAVPEVKSNPMTTFYNSSVNEFSKFELRLEAEKELGIDLFYYFNAVKNWSEINPSKKRTETGWIATARTFITRDNDSKKVKMVHGNTNVQSDADYINYLED